MTTMHKEILEQPDVFEDMLQAETEHVKAVAQELREQGATYVVIAARGSSDNAARYAKYLFGSKLGLQVALATPSLFTIYEQMPRMDKALVIGISQSGQSQDIRAVIEEAKRQGSPTLAITNMPDSPLAGIADHVLDTHAGPERSVPATKTYTTQVGMLGLLAACWLDDDAVLAELQQVPDLQRQTLALAAEVLPQAIQYRYADNCVVLGRGYNYGTAFECSLKLKETCYLSAEPYSPADFKHGPVALVDWGFPVLVIAPSGPVFEHLYTFAAEIKERGASLIVISDRDEALALADLPFRIPPASAEWLTPIYSVIPGQLLALTLSQARGIDPDQPRAIHKITDTR